MNRLNSSMEEKDKKFNRALGTCEIITKDLTFTSLESWEGKKRAWRKMAENLPYLAEDINLQVQEADQTQTGWTQKNPHKKLP